MIAQENRAARAERLAAQEHHKSKIAPAKGAGWSTKAAARRRSAEARKRDAERAAEREQARLAWARRHPQAAAAERSFRKERAEIADRWSHKAQGTPQTHEANRRKCEGAIARLWSSGAIDDDQLAYAAEIAGVVERIGGDVLIKTASLETRVDTQRLGDGTFHEQLGHVRREWAYGLWRQRLGANAAPVLEVIVSDVALTIVASRHRMHNRRAKRILIEALDLWPHYLAAARQAIDEATLAAAHAGIL